MLPLSGRLEAASKSNSSTLEPSTITTRVSSGWLASMSIRLVMEISGARARVAGGTPCGGAPIGKELAARMERGGEARVPFRRNGHKDRDSVGKERKFDSHCYLHEAISQG